MDWYYAKDNQQIGPVSDEEFQRLVQSGEVSPATLVWKDGMSEWKPFGSLKSEPPAEGLNRCAECQKDFPFTEMVQFKNQWICATCKPLFFQRIQEGGNLKTDYEYASFGRRLSAKILDGLILSMLFVIPFLIYFIMKGPGVFQGTEFLIYINIYQYGYMVVSWFYCMVFIGKYGATPGKMALKIQVIGEYGEKISYLKSLGRTLSEIISQVICYLGYLICLFDSEKRTLHDRICHTRVVMKSSLPDKLK